MFIKCALKGLHTQVETKTTVYKSLFGSLINRRNILNVNKLGSLKLNQFSTKNFGNNNKENFQTKITEEVSSNKEYNYSVFDEYNNEQPRSRSREDLKKNYDSGSRGKRYSDNNNYNNENNSNSDDAEIKELNYQFEARMDKEETKVFYKENEIEIRNNQELIKVLPDPIMTIDDLQCEESLKDYFTRKFEKPTAIQSVGWNIALSGRNMVGIAETGSGKTLSFIIPALIHIKNNLNNPRPFDKAGPIALIIAPTRELAMQIFQVVNEYSQIIKIRSACLYGGVPKSDQIRTLVRGVELVVATPGRLLDLIYINKTNLYRTSFVILDEADRMLDMGFEEDLKRILKMVHRRSQILMWSATWPKEIVRLAEDFLRDYVHIKIGSSEMGLAVNKRIKQEFIFCEEYEKLHKLDDVINQILSQRDNNDDLPKFIIFTNKKMKCDKLVYHLTAKFQEVDSIHGDKNQVQRDFAIKSFKNGKVKILVATDVAARGLDVNDVEYIINYDFPPNLDDYVHRIGRTGRSGKFGTAFSLFTREAYGLIKTLKNFLIKAEQNVPHEFAILEHKRGGQNTRSNYGRSRVSYSPRH